MHLSVRVLLVLRGILAGIPIGLLAGCSLFPAQSEKVAKYAGRIVTEYCENITLPEVRAQMRDAVNKHSSPHALQVTCAEPVSIDQ